MSRRKPLPPQAASAAPVGLMVVVYRAGEALFVLDEACRAAAPPANADRASVALALAQAADRLTAIGTLASHGALEVLEIATRRQAEAFDAALALIDAELREALGGLGGKLAAIGVQLNRRKAGWRLTPVIRKS